MVNPFYIAAICFLIVTLACATAAVFLWPRLIYYKSIGGKIETWKFGTGCSAGAITALVITLTLLSYGAGYTDPEAKDTDPKTP